MEALFAICGAIPFCLYPLVGLVVVAVFIKVLVDRLNNEEDDYYTKNVKK